MCDFQKEAIHFCCFPLRLCDFASLRDFVHLPLLLMALVNDRHPNLFGPISGLPLVGLDSLAVQTSIESSTLSAKFNGRSIGQDFRGPLAEFRRIVAHSDNGIGADLGRVLHHAVEGVLPSMFADLGVFFDIAAENAFQTAFETLRNSRRSHHDAADYAEVLNNRPIRDLVTGGDDHDGFLNSDICVEGVVRSE
jgi:hypothetical protein